MIFFFFFLEVGTYHITLSFSLDAKVTGLMKKVILIGHNLLENNTSQHSVFSITPKIAVT